MRAHLVLLDWDISCGCMFLLIFNNTGLVLILQVVLMNHFFPFFPGLSILPGSIYFMVVAMLFICLLCFND